MVWAFLLEPSLSNCNPLACKIGYLANPVKNSVFTAAVLLGVMGARSRLGPYALPAVIILSMLGSHSIIPALTNTFFTIHPPLLYVFTGLTIRAVALSQRRLSIVYLFFWAISMCMGGFWSMQELSWGGWWNWDVVECGVAYQWAVAALLLHKSFKGAGLATSASLSIWACALVYTTLNKLGVGVSIHSFVTSVVVQNHYSMLLALCSLFITVSHATSLNSALALTALMLGLYCGSRSFSIAKPVLLLALTLAPAVRTRKPALSSSHSLFFAAGWSIVVFNYHNYAFFFNYTPSKSLAALTCSYRFWGADISAPDRQKLIWDGFWLSKPRYSLSFCLESWSTRSTFLRSAFSAFMK